MRRRLYDPGVTDAGALEDMSVAEYLNSSSARRK
jgi:hypothetical protein